MCNAIFVFGPSCSGKSTLGKALQKSLGGEWTYVDRDDLIEQNVCTESTANTTLDDRIRSINNIIIDAQIPWREKRKGELYCMVLPPLEVLLKRDTERTVELRRPPQRAHWAREYVIETYSALNKMDKTNFDCCFDSSKDSINDEVTQIRSLILMEQVRQVKEVEALGNAALRLIASYVSPNIS